MKINVDMPCPFKFLSDCQADVRHFVVRFAKQSEFENFSQQDDRATFYARNTEELRLLELNSKGMVGVGIQS